MMMMMTYLIDPHTMTMCNISFILFLSRDCVKEVGMYGKYIQNIYRSFLHNIVLARYLLTHHSLAVCGYYSNVAYASRWKSCGIMWWVPKDA